MRVYVYYTCIWGEDTKQSQGNKYNMSFVHRGLAIFSGAHNSTNNRNYNQTTATEHASTYAMAKARQASGPNTTYTPCLKISNGRICWRGIRIHELIKGGCKARRCWIVRSSQHPRLYYCRIRMTSFRYDMYVLKGKGRNIEELEATKQNQLCLIFSREHLVRLHAHARYRSEKWNVVFSG